VALTDNLISYWKLNEVSGARADSVGTNNLTDNNTVAGVAGKIGNATQHVAVNLEYLSIASNATLQTGDIDFTWACWAQVATKTARQGIIVKDANVAGAAYLLEYENTQDRFRCRIDVSATLRADILGSPTANTWYFLVFWHDSTANTINIQGNNGVANSAALVHDGLTDAAPFEIGRFITFYLDGMVDEVGFWKRVLTAQEKTDLYNGGAGLSYPFTSGSGQSHFKNAIRIGI